MKLSSGICSLLMFVGVTAAQGQVIFSQDFSSSATVSSYASASSPSSGQFNAISTSGSGTVVSISSGALSFARSGSNAGAFSRTTDFSPTPIAILYKFDVSVTGNSAATTNVAAFQVGSGFGTTNSAEANANVHSRVGVNFTSTVGSFSLRNIGSGTNSSNLSGTQTLRWYINNTGSSMNYTGPDSSTYSLANDTAQLWAGNARIFASISATTPSQSLTDLKFAFSDGSGTILIDNISISAIPEPSSFAVIASGFALACVASKRRRNS